MKKQRDISSQGWLDFGQLYVYVANEHKFPILAITMMAVRHEM